MKLFLVLVFAAAVQLCHCATPLEDVTEMVNKSINSYLTIGPILQFDINAFLQDALVIMETFLEGAAPNDCIKGISTSLSAVPMTVMTAFERCQKPILELAITDTNAVLATLGGVLDLQLGSTPGGGVVNCANTLQKVLADVKKVPEELLVNTVKLLGDFDALLIDMAECCNVAYVSAAMQLTEHFKGVLKCLK